MVRSFLCLCCGLVGSVVSFGQTFRGDSTFVAEARSNSISLYSSAIAGQSHLYNGSAYTEYLAQKDEHPYFVDEWIEGTVLYDAEYHTNVPILYDVVLDRIIIDNGFTIKKVMLVHEKVKAFTIGKSRFVHITDGSLPEGHYQLAYDGDVKVYIHHKKTLQSRIVDRVIVNQFEDRKTYYIYKDGKFTSVRGKGSVIKVFRDKKKELKKFTRDNRLAFRSDRGRDMSRLAEYYDQLK
jgi:hypothetical protein